MFRPSCGHLQGGENKNKNIVNMSLNYFTALNAMDFLPLKKGPTGCPETSVRNYHYWLRNNPEARNSHVIFELQFHDEIVLFRFSTAAIQ